jgi:hypothetical protein
MKIYVLLFLAHGSLNSAIFQEDFPNFEPVLRGIRSVTALPLLTFLGLLKGPILLKSVALECL